MGSKRAIDNLEFRIKSRREKKTAEALRWEDLTRLRYKEAPDGQERLKD